MSREKPEDILRACSVSKSIAFGAAECVMSAPSFEIIKCLILSVRLEAAGQYHFSRNGIFFEAFCFQFHFQFIFRPVRSKAVGGRTDPFSLFGAKKSDPYFRRAVVSEIINDDFTDKRSIDAVLPDSKTYPLSDRAVEFHDVKKGIVVDLSRDRRVAFVIVTPEKIEFVICTKFSVSFPVVFRDLAQHDAAM